MPTVTVPIDGDTLRLPRRCLVCGAERCRLRKTTFHAGARALYCSVPLCRDHASHFDAHVMRALLLIGGLLATAALAVAGAVTLHPLALLAGLVFGVVAVAAFIMVDANARRKLVHATHLTEREVTLVNVHRSVAEAVEGEEHAAEDGDEEWSFGRRTMRVIWFVVAAVFVLMFVGVTVVALAFLSLLGRT